MRRVFLALLPALIFSAEPARSEPSKQSVRQSDLVCVQEAEGSRRFKVGQLRVGTKRRRCPRGSVKAQRGITQDELGNQVSVLVDKSVNQEKISLFNVTIQQLIDAAVENNSDALLNVLTQIADLVSQAKQGPKGDQGDKGDRGDDGTPGPAGQDSLVNGYLVQLAFPLFPAGAIIPAGVPFPIGPIACNTPGEMAFGPGVVQLPAGLKFIGQLMPIIVNHPVSARAIINGYMVILDGGPAGVGPFAVNLSITCVPVPG